VKITLAKLRFRDKINFVSKALNICYFY